MQFELSKVDKVYVSSEEIKVFGAKDVNIKIEEAEFYHENFSQVPAVSHLKGSDGR